MNNRRVLIVYIFLFIAIFAGCVNRSNDSQNIDTEQVKGTISPYLTTEGYLEPCELIAVAEWQILFDESPLFVEAVNGGCLIKNQWDTRSVFIGVFPDTQALQYMRWFTQSLTNQSDDPEFLFHLRDVLESHSDSDLRTLLDARIPLYEELLFRTERIFVIGDFSMWFSYHESFTNILEILEGNQYLRIEILGFYPVDARKMGLEIGNMIIGRVPSQFDVLFNQTESSISLETPFPTIETNQPRVTNVVVQPEEIYFGSLCAQEVSQIQITIESDDLVNSVLFVYRLKSEEETNQNWKTVFMSKEESGVWVKSFNAETDFSGYKLIHNASVEAYIGIIYEVEKVLNLPVFQVLQVKQCGVDN